MAMEASTSPLGHFHFGNGQLGRIRIASINPSNRGPFHGFGLTDETRHDVPALQARIEFNQIDDEADFVLTTMVFLVEIAGLGVVEWAAPNRPSARAQLPRNSSARPR